MLLNTFFDIVEITENQQEGAPAASSDSYTIHIKVYAGHPIFKGHFPGNPVVPGACQIRMITEIISAIKGREMRLLEADNLKFLSMINPNEHPQLTVDCLLKENEDGSFKVTASISDKEHVFFKYKSLVA